MILYISLIYAHLLKSFNENLFIGLDEDGLIMVDKSNAKAISRRQDKAVEINSVFKFDSGKGICTSGENKLSVCSKDTGYKVVLTLNGSLLINDGNMCWGYYKGSKNVKLGKCSDSSFNSSFVFVENPDSRVGEVRMRFGPRRNSSDDQGNKSTESNFRQIEAPDLKKQTEPYKRDSTASTAEGAGDGVREFVKFNVF